MLVVTLHMKFLNPLSTSHLHVTVLCPQEGYKSDVTDSLASELQQTLCDLPYLSTEVVLDDRNKLSIGRRVQQAKQMGYPHIITVGKKVTCLAYSSHLENLENLN